MELAAMAMEWPDSESHRPGSIRHRRVTHMARNDDGKPTCIMQSQISFTNGATAFVVIKWTKGQSNRFIQLSKTNWQFAPDLQVPFSIKLDNGSREFVGVSKTYSHSSLIYTHLIDEGNDWL